jgi:import inner membrane translocase subunit TIM16
MAIGPFARILAQVVVPVIAVLARALPAAYAQALHNAKKAGTTAETATASLRKTISRSEALQVLNLAEEEATAEAIQKQYERLMKANEVKNGTGSFYLQSKVYRAHELLMEFNEEKRREQQQQPNDATATSTSTTDKKE